jgi:hypothetical protein
MILKIIQAGPFFGGIDARFAEASIVPTKALLVDSFSVSVEIVHGRKTISRLFTIGDGALVGSVVSSFMLAIDLN